VCYSVLQYDACVAMWYELWRVSLCNRDACISQIRMCKRNVFAVCLQCFEECGSVLQSVAVCG